jgi:hypothetical protein
VVDAVAIAERAEARAEADPQHCNHVNIVMTVRNASNGAAQYQKQCLDCGGKVGEFVKKVIALQQSPVPFDDALHGKWYQAQTLALQDARQADSVEWWAWYNEYLKSPEWQWRRKMVMDREAGLCQGCRTVRAKDVHHLTYAHVGDEPLYELVALCGECHQKNHPDKKIG